MNTEELISAIKVEFETLLQAKTNWGRNDVKALHDQALINVLSRIN